jgi:hypothetical protein
VKTSYDLSAIAPEPGIENAVTFSTDVDILNYALTLEYLEAEMYRQAVASGKLSGDALALAMEFGGHEQGHVDALNAAIPKLGGTPVKPRQRYNFPAMTDQATIMAFISKIEDTGVGAYLGQVGAVQSGDVLGAAASIFAVEALHTAAIRTLLGNPANPNGAFEVPLAADQVLAAAGPLLGPEAGAAPPSTAPGTAQMPTHMPTTGGGWGANQGASKG